MFFQSQWQLSLLTLIKTVFCNDRRDPVSMTVINSQKHIGQAGRLNQQPSVMCATNWCTQYTVQFAWLIDLMVFYATFNSISVISRQQLTLFLGFHQY